MRPVHAAAASGRWRPSLLQIFLVEEGTYADQVVDVTKFQNFMITVVLVLAYVSLAVHSRMPAAVLSPDPGGPATTHAGAGTLMRSEDMAVVPAYPPQRAAASRQPVMPVAPVKSARHSQSAADGRGCADTRPCGR